MVGFRSPLVSPRGGVPRLLDLGSPAEGGHGPLGAVWSLRWGWAVEAGLALLRASGSPKAVCR